MTFSINDAVERCRSAQSAWSETPLRQRLACVRRLRHLFAEHADRLCLSVTQDIGRPAPEVLATDVLPSADAFRFLERRAASILRAQRIPGRFRPWWLIGEREVIHRRPYGIVGIIGTWNYPILLNAVSIAQAFAAGNGVVWKPSELTPLFAECLHDLFAQAGFPPELYVRLPAEREFGSALVEADVDHVIFTGSANVGRKVAARLGERLIPCTLELSGCDAMFVLDDADAKLAARAAWFGFTINNGQTCLAIRRVFVHRSRQTEFEAALKTLAQSAKPQPLALLGQASQAERLVRDAIDRGGRVLGESVPAMADDPPRFPPTVILDAKPDMAICQEAAFSPVMSVLSFDDERELIRMNEQCPYGLGASVFTGDSRRGRAFAHLLRVGSVSINDVLVGTAHPAIGFGGVRQSGWGVTRGAEGLLALTAPQVVTTRSGRFRPHFDTSNSGLYSMLRGMLNFSHAKRISNRLRGIRGMIGGMVRFLKAKPGEPRK